MIAGHVFNSFRHFSTYSLRSIPAFDYVERRQQLIENLLKECDNSGDKNAVFALMISRPKTFSAPDVPHPYRQCSHFRYFCGIEEPRARILIGTSESVIFMEPQTKHQVLWDGASQDVNEVRNISGVNQVLPICEFHKYMANVLKNGTTLAVDVDALLDAIAYEPDLRGVHQMLYNGGLTHRPLNDKIDQLRWRKSENEQELMRETCRIGSESLNALLREGYGETNESNIVGFLEHQCRRRGADSLAYPPVVAAGNNANTIHYISSNKHIRRTDCVLVDAGCDLHGYVSDITRCFPISGKFSAVQRTLYDVLNDLQSQLLHYVQTVRPIRLNENFSSTITWLSVWLILYLQSFSFERICHERNCLKNATNSVLIMYLTTSVWTCTTPLQLLKILNAPQE